jgi:hypothetical protein
MKTIFRADRKNVLHVYYIRVFENTRMKEIRYCVHFSKEERESYENFNRYRHRPLYRLNVRLRTGV